jgi:hypothetical protein
MSVIITPDSLLSESRSSKRDIDIDIYTKNINKPADIQRNLFGKSKEYDIYFPVYNANYNHWQEKHHKDGGGL